MKTLFLILLAITCLTKHPTAHADTKPVAAREMKFSADFQNFLKIKHVDSYVATKTTSTVTIRTHARISPTVLQKSHPIRAILRREKILEQFHAELRGVREYPNRWLRKVLGLVDTLKLAPLANRPPDYAQHHRQHSGIKHATVRRSRYL